MAKTGDDRDRTGNLRLAKPALSQLSYVPGRDAGQGTRVSQRPCGQPTLCPSSPVGVRGFEPRTSALSELRSNQLSYTPLRPTIPKDHVRPATPSWRIVPPLSSEHHGMSADKVQTVPPREWFGRHGRTPRLVSTGAASCARRFPGRYLPGPLDSAAARQMWTLCWMPTGKPSSRPGFTRMTCS